jgi:Domain of unknown function (DUF4337)
MAVSDIAERAETVVAEGRWTAVLVGALAVLLAICTMGGDNAAKDAAKANLDATNNWAFFQAKNMRRMSINLAADELDLKLATEPAMAAEGREKVAAKLAEYKAMAQKLTSDPEKKEGLDELYQRGKELEAVRDAALARDPYFDWSAALMQIAIVLLSVSIVAASRPLLWTGIAVGIAGTALMINGFTMLVTIPGLG